MMRFNIEKYVRSVLEDHTLDLRKDAWQDLSDKLDKQEQKKTQRLIYRKVALFIAVFITGLFPLTNKSDREINTSSLGDIGNLDNAEETKRIKVAATEICEINKTPLVADEVRKKENGGTRKQEKIAQSAPDLAGTGSERSSSVIMAYFNATPEHVMVSDMEVDSLLQRVYENIQREKLLLREQKWVSLPARQLLAEVTDVEREIEPNEDDRSLFLNHLIRKFLKIETTFSN